MKRLSKWAGACSAAALAAGATSALAAPGPAPTAARPNFDGIWQVDRPYNVQAGTKPSDGSPTPFLPWTKTLFDGGQKAVADGEPWTTNHQFCLDAGQVRTTKGNFPFQVVLTNDQLLFMFEEEGRVQQIPIVARARATHPKNPVPTWNGHTVGYWDGDTLVVDTVGFNDKTPFIPAVAHTSALHTVDRYRLRPDGKFEVRMTIDDPGAYSKTWETLVVFSRVRPGYKLRDYRCAENNRDLPTVGQWGLY
jgi:hypothetical protein